MVHGPSNVKLIVGLRNYAKAFKNTSTFRLVVYISVVLKHLNLSLSKIAGITILYLNYYMLLHQ